MPNSKRTKLLRRLVLCFAANVALLLLLVALIWRFADESAYFRFGPCAALRIIWTRRTFVAATFPSTFL
jgi:hypothetical protein